MIRWRFILFFYILAQSVMANLCAENKSGKPAYIYLCLLFCCVWLRRGVKRIVSSRWCVSSVSYFFFLQINQATLLSPEPRPQLPTLAHLLRPGLFSSLHVQRKMENEAKPVRIISADLSPPKHTLPDKRYSNIHKTEIQKHKNIHKPISLMGRTMLIEFQFEAPI